jgi:hypothetical protein
MSKILLIHNLNVNYFFEYKNFLFMDNFYLLFLKRNTYKNYGKL